MSPQRKLNDGFSSKHWRCTMLLLLFGPRLLRCSIELAGLLRQRVCRRCHQ